VIAVVFAGPSLPPSARQAAAELRWRPPVRQGDLYDAARARPSVIGLVDGYFDVVPTVWHKEILWAMAQGIHVYGSASIGALRAVELAPFGMKGIGHIFEAYRNGTLQDDDEVVVLHGPEEVGYVPLTEAMVNIRATVERAVRDAVIDPMAAAALIAAARSLFYKDRTYEAILLEAAGRGLAQAAVGRFAEWLPVERVDQKRMDALAMVEAIRGHLAADPAPLTVSFQLARTAAWELARLRADCRPLSEDPARPPS
jgi:hypothetical protein